MYIVYAYYHDQESQMRHRMVIPIISLKINLKIAVRLIFLMQTELKFPLNPKIIIIIAFEFVPAINNTIEIIQTPVRIGRYCFMYVKPNGNLRNTKHLILFLMDFHFFLMNLLLFLSSRPV